MDVETALTAPLPCEEQCRPSRSTAPPSEAYHLSATFLEQPLTAWLETDAAGAVRVNERKTRATEA